MKLYICHFPGCEYCTETRSKIELHHIVPKELWPRLNQKVTLSFCPTHHRLIFHPECKSGPHSTKSDASLIIKGIFKSSTGYAVEYEDMNGNDFFQEFDK